MPKRLTQSHWLNTLKQKAESDHGPAIRRQHTRHYAIGTATIREKTPANPWSEKPSGAQGELLQVSPGGCMIRTHRELKPGTFVEVEIPIDNDVYVTSGKVIHSTGTIGGYKTGIQLMFPEPVGQAPGSQWRDWSFKKHKP